ncbi:hypothetical protein HQ571_06640 [Candidatus Kuenenbacteria bacterium]|nr:hypothetical protein [Candidatus Kuenenbacteria bacterium]
MEHEPESKYLTLWVCVIIAAVVIFVGWFISLKYNFQKINQEMDQNVNKTTEQAAQEVQDMLDGVNDLISQDDALQEGEADTTEKLQDLEKKVEELSDKIIEQVDENQIEPEPVVE